MEILAWNHRVDDLQRILNDGEDGMGWLLKISRRGTRCAGTGLRILLILQEDQLLIQSFGISLLVMEFYHNVELYPFPLKNLTLSCLLTA